MNSHEQSSQSAVSGSSAKSYSGWKGVMSSIAYYSAVLATVLMLARAGLAQSGSSDSAKPPEGVSSGGYTIHQSIEAGYRYTDQTGSDGMYDTLVDLHSGPRVLEQSLSMQSQTHESLLFDNFYVHSFGWGGDPENVLRARVDKNKWYDFRASFRRDQNFFDFDLLANPLNPGTSSPDRPVANSPHLFATRRRMSDLDLTLLPQSRLSFRLGYSRNNMTGPSFSSVHEGTDALLYQPWNTTLNSYRVGVDWKILRRTMLSYDQILDYYKGDTDWQLATANPAQLPGGAGGVELGLPFDTTNRFPCAPTGGNTAIIDASGNLTNIACNAYLAYSRQQRVRTSTPTERLSLRTSTIPRLDFTASYSYSSAEVTAPYNEFFNGLVSRTGNRQFTITGPEKANMISNVVEFGATYRLTEHLRLTDTFYFWAYRIPQSFTSTETDWTVPGINNANPCRPPACSLLVDVNTLTPGTTVTPSALSFNQKLKRNQVELGWDVNKHFGARIGYRYSNRFFDHVLDFLAADEDQLKINEHTALIGFWARPSTPLRFNLDFERVAYDNVLVRMAPRKEYRYRMQVGYNPRPWAVLGGSINVLEDTNKDSLTNYRGHNRNIGFTASLAPRDRYGFDLAYNYNDYLQNALMCFADVPAAGVALPVVTGASVCTADPANPLLTDSFYVNRSHFGMVSAMVKPVKRVTTRLGYSITSVDGETPQFNILQPLGSLASTYHHPLANLSVEVVKNVSWNAGWNYYQYNEKSFVGPTDSRYFHGNTATFSLHYEF